MRLFKLLLFLFFYNCKASWAELTLSNLTLEEKIGQLFIIGFENNDYINKGNNNQKRINNINAEKIIKEQKIGGIHFKKNGSLENCFNAIKNFQSISKIPLFISQDFEWGLNMRLTETIKFPFNMTLGAIGNNDLIYELGREIGNQCKLLGVNINFAPVVDINSNPLNPVIGKRSFGQNRENVAYKSINFAKGLQDAGIVACAKHFCGHGDTDVDSHFDLPIIQHSIERLKDVEIYPFAKIINSGIKAIMSAHIHVPAIDSRKNIPITLSYNAMTNILQKELGFTGLIITDSLDMQGVAKYFESGEVELEAFLAGNDIFLMSQDITTAISRIKDAILNNEIDIKELDRRVLKILKIKEELNLHKQNFNNEFNYNDFHTKNAYDLKNKLYESAITIVANNENIIPIKENKSMVLILIGNQVESYQDFYNELQQFYPNLQTLLLSNNDPLKNFDNVYNLIDKYEIIIIGLFDLDRFDGSDDCMKDSLNFINKLNLNKQLILSIFGNPYSLKFFKHIKNVIMAYEEDKDAQIATAKIIFGKVNPLGELPISI